MNVAAGAVSKGAGCFSRGNLRGEVRGELRDGPRAGPLRSPSIYTFPYRKFTACTERLVPNTHFQSGVPLARLSG